MEHACHARYMSAGHAMLGCPGQNTHQARMGLGLTDWSHSDPSNGSEKPRGKPRFWARTFATCLQGMWCSDARPCQNTHQARMGHGSVAFRPIDWQEAISTRTHKIKFLRRFPSLITLKIVPPSTKALYYVFKMLNQKLTSKVQFYHESGLPGVPTPFMTDCRIVKSWLNAETWMDDRLRPCKHISLVS